MKILANEDKSIIVSEDGEQCILKYSENYYKLKKEEIEKIFDTQKFTYKKKMQENPIYSILMTIVIIITIVIYFSFENYIIIDSNIIIANFILIINIFIHEIGHIIVLKQFFKYSKIKLGFKFFFIYPSFYVDTSDSYLLPKYKRIAVYLAGNFFNCLYLLICFFLFPNLNQYNYMIITTILINFLPIIKSDGYYAFLCLFNKYNISKSRKMNYLEDFIRGLIMFLFLILLSKINSNR